MGIPVFLDLDQVMRLHRGLIERYGGIDGTRDIGMLQFAIAMPQMAFGGRYLHEDEFEMAAAYLYHIVQNHPFLDGNKRTGTAAVVNDNYKHALTTTTNRHGHWSFSWVEGAWLEVVASPCCPLSGLVWSPISLHRSAVCSRRFAT